MALRKNSYWSVHASLYESLPPEHITRLEEAVKARFLGQLDESLRIFEESLPPAHTVPAIALEKISLLQWMSEERVSTELCSRSLEELRRNESSEPSLSHLLTMTIGLSEIHTQGKLFEALILARKYREHLAHVPVSSYTSLEVQRA